VLLLNIETPEADIAGENEDEASLPQPNLFFFGA